MDIQALRVFLVLCRNLHFGRTSSEVHMSASALSRMVQRLEDNVGYPLLIRDNRSVVLTEQGQMLRRYATEVVSGWDELKQQMGSEDLTGQLTLFASVTASQNILPDVLSRFRRDYPDIHIQLETGYAIDAMQRLKTGTDVVVAALDDEPEARLEKKLITTTPIVGIASSEWLATVGSEPDWHNVPLVLPGSGQVRRRIEQWLREVDVKPKIYAEVDGNEAIVSLVALGCGVGFVPRLVWETSQLRQRLELFGNFGDFHVGFCTTKRHLEKSAIIRAFWSSIDAGNSSLNSPQSS